MHPEQYWLPRSRLWTRYPGDWVADGAQTWVPKGQRAFEASTFLCSQSCPVSLGFLQWESRQGSESKLKTNWRLRSRAQEGGALGRDRTDKMVPRDLEMQL